MWWIPGKTAPRHMEEGRISPAVVPNNLQHLVVRKAEAVTSAETLLALRVARFPLSLCAPAARHSLWLKELQRTPPPGHTMRGPRRSVPCKPIVSREFVASALCVASTFALRCGLAVLTAPVVSSLPARLPYSRLTSLRHGCASLRGGNNRPIRSIPGQ